MLHGELGRYPIEINIKMRMINFWISILNSNFNKLTNIMYKLLLSDYIPQASITTNGSYISKIYPKTQGVTTYGWSRKLET